MLEYNTAMHLVDSHCHLDFKDFDHDRGKVIDGAAAAGVREIVVPGVKRATWRRLVALCEARRGLFHALGLHPMFMHVHRPEHLDDLEAEIDTSRPVAVGEVGLDYQDKGADRETQLWYFERQVEIAARRGLPLILHVRKAHDDVLAVLRSRPVCGGISHAFNGSRQQAGKYIDLGFKLGFGGMLTFERSRRLRGLARELPLDALVLETDAPDMAVARFRGQRNSPEYIPDVLVAMAAARGEAPERVAEATTRNAREVLGLEYETD